MEDKYGPLLKVSYGIGEVLKGTCCAFQASKFVIIDRQVDDQIYGLGCTPRKVYAYQTY